MHGDNGTKVLSWRFLSGPALTAATLLMITVAERAFAVIIPNPAVIYLTAVVYASFEGGIVSGAVSAGITLCYAAWFFSLPGHLFHYSPDNAARMIVLALATPAIMLMTGVLRRRSDRMLREQQQLVADLQKALAEIKTLQGIVPICAACKKIRDDKGYWNQVEIYVEEHSHARFSHGLCPDCARRLYPELFEGKDIDPELLK